MVEIIRNLLIVISGICWSVVYVQCARIGFREKTYCMPLFALGLNFAWEGIYAFTDIFVRHSLGAQAIANAAWFVLDIFILVTWFRYGKKEFSGKEKLFLPWTVLVIATSFVLQFLFMYEFGDVEGEKYSAFLQNIAMSLCFLSMLERRRPVHDHCHLQVHRHPDPHDPWRHGEQYVYPGHRHPLLCF